MTLVVVVIDFLSIHLIYQMAPIIQLCILFFLISPVWIWISIYFILIDYAHDGM